MTESTDSLKLQSNKDQQNRAVTGTLCAQNNNRRHIRLLGGQKVMLLDDPFSAMDAHTTERILEGLQPMMAGRTVVVVAHRVATVRRADQILMMDQGRVVERGSHEELLALGGHYAALYARQQDRDESEGGAA